ncbi:antibiotic biosynthesis monooxygenase family protein [Heyndrickxia sp. NPDC080065]|uniref:antibiotic biosynthesis monooxygenase family protein n=1 Tax=Heyndrickxia sp. NPDC080065 TaxID=3390568 RepID=UPI003D06E7CE
MNFYITTGTYDFLEKIFNKYKDEKIILMQNAQNSLLIHETEKKSIFGAPRKYEVLDRNGELENCGFVVFYNIPISDEGKPVFEYGYKNKKHLIENAFGNTASRLLKPKKGDTYIIFTMWKDEKDYKRWKNTDSYKTFISEHKTENPLSSNSLFNGTPYETEYTIPNDENQNASQ